MCEKIVLTFKNDIQNEIRTRKKRKKKKLFLCYINSCFEFYDLGNNV